MLTVCGQHDRAVANLRASATRRCDQFVRDLQTRHPKPEWFPCAGLLTEVFIFQQMNRCVASPLAAAPVAATGGGGRLPGPHRDTRGLGKCNSHESHGASTFHRQLRESFPVAGIGRPRARACAEGRPGGKGPRGRPPAVGASGVEPKPQACMVCYGRQGNAWCWVSFP